MSLNLHLLREYSFNLPCPGGTCNHKRGSIVYGENGCRLWGRGVVRGGASADKSRRLRGGESSTRGGARGVGKPKGEGLSGKPGSPFVIVHRVSRELLRRKGVT